MNELAPHARPGRPESAAPLPAFVYYSISWRPRLYALHQWLQSIRSLRLHNETIPVLMFLYGELEPGDGSDELLREADEQNVQVIRLGDFAASLPHPKRAVLARFPLWHKLLSLRHAPPAEQIIYADCD